MSRKPKQNKFKAKATNKSQHPMKLKSELTKNITEDWKNKKKHSLKHLPQNKRKMNPGGPNLQSQL